jgi:hypothetical protein
LAGSVAAGASGIIAPSATALFAVWRTNVITRPPHGTGVTYYPHFPELRMYLGCSPATLSSRTTPYGQFDDWVRVVEAGMVRWHPRQQSKPLPTGSGYEVPIALHNRARNKLMVFALYDLLPIYLTLLTLALALALALRS